MNNSGKNNQWVKTLGKFDNDLYKGEVKLSPPAPSDQT